MDNTLAVPAADLLLLIEGRDVASFRKTIVPYNGCEDPVNQSVIWPNRDWSEGPRRFTLQAVMDLTSINREIKKPVGPRSKAGTHVKVRTVFDVEL